MDKNALPKNFPAGNLRLTRMLSARGRTGATRALPPLMARTGPRMAYRPGSTLAKDERTLRAHADGGTLAQWSATRPGAEMSPAVQAPVQAPEMPAAPAPEVKAASATTSFARAIVSGPKVPKPPKSRIPAGAKLATWAGKLVANPAAQSPFVGATEKILTKIVEEAIPQAVTTTAAVILSSWIANKLGLRDNPPAQILPVVIQKEAPSLVEKTSGADGSDPVENLRERDARSILRARLAARRVS